MKIVELDLINIFRMLKKENNQKRIDDLVARILDYHTKDREIYEVYKCLKDIKINDELLTKYKDNGNVLYLLAIEGAEPHTKILSLATNVCDIRQIKNLCERYFIPIKHYEDKIIESKDPIYYANALKQFDKYITYGMNFNRLREEFIKLPVVEDNKNDYFTTISLMLEKLDFNLKHNMLLVEILKENSSDRALDFVCKMLELKDFTSNLKIRKDWLYLFEYFKEYCESQKNRYGICEDRFNYNRITNYLNKLKNYKNNILNKIMNLEINDIAWQVKALDFNNEELIKILNYWAREGKALEFDLYFDYLSAPTLDYENIGKHIDAKYQNMLAPEKTKNKPEFLGRTRRISN